MLYVDAAQSFFYINEGQGAVPKMIPVYVQRDQDDPWRPLLAQRNLFYRGLVLRL